MRMVRLASASQYVTTTRDCVVDAHCFHKTFMRDNVVCRRVVL
jgi:hypothetical protein